MIPFGPANLRAGSGWALASVGVALVSGLVRTIVVARFLGPDAIGLMGIALLSLGFLEAVASTGVDTALVAKRKDAESFIDPAFTIQLTRGLVVLGVLWIGAPAVARVVQTDAALGVIRSVGAIAVIRGLANPAVSLAVRRLEFRRMFWWSLPEQVSSVALTVVLAFVRRDVWALVIGVVVGQAVGTIASYGLVPRRPRPVLARQRIYDLLRFGRFVSGARALMYFSVNLDGAVVGITMGTHALGLYQFATRVAELPVVTFTRAVAQVALPALSGQHARAAAVSRTWKSMLRSVLAVNTAAALLIVSFGDTAVSAVAGEQWLAAVPLMRVLAIAMLFRAVIVLTGQLLDAMGQPALTMRLNAVRLVALTVLLPAFAAWFGLYGIAQAVLLANAVAVLYAMRLSARVLDGLARSHPMA